MPKKTARDQARQEAVDRFGRFLDEETRQLQGDGDSASVQEAYWARARAALFVNAASSGKETMDAIMEAVRKGEDPTGAWTTPILLLPPPSRQLAVAATAGSPPSPGDKRRSSGSSSQPPAKKSKRDKKDKAGSKSASSSSSSKTATCPSPSQDLSTLGFELAAGVAPQLRADLFGVFNSASAQGLAPFQLAYPWSGVRVWYNPVLYKDVHLAHWRFWQEFRRIFWLCAMHPPLPPGKEQNYYRKQKMKACRARLSFISLCVEEWGYVEFLKLMDKGCTRLFWFGGRPGRHSPTGTSKKGLVDQDLAALHSSDNARYQRRIEGALEPLRIDEEGFSSVTEILVSSAALDPDKVAHSRLSDQALARVCSDLLDDKRLRRSWSPKAIQPMFSKLKACKRIKALRLPDLLQDISVPGYEAKESKLPGYTPFKHKDGKYTALAPLAGGEVTFPVPGTRKAEDDPEIVSDEEDEDESEAEEAASEAGSPAAEEEEADSESGSEAASEAGADEGKASGAESSPSDEDDEEEEKPPVPTPADPAPKSRSTKTRSAAKTA